MKKFAFVRNTKRFLILFLSIFIVLSIVLMTSYESQINRLKKEITTETETQISIFSQTFKDEISEAITNVFLIKDLIYVHDSLILDGDHTVFDNLTSKQIIQNEFSVWLGMKNTYDQMRIIDNTGMEIVRVNYNNGDPVIVDDSLLQDKSTRYYFTDSIVLDENEVFISPLDLNIENNEIEYVDGKVKPMIRIASPLFNDAGEKLGIIIVNYLAESLFNQLDNIDSSLSQGVEVINKDGYYLYAVEEEIEFGFMFDNKQDQVFSNYHDFDILNYATSTVSTTLYDDEYYTAIEISDDDLTSSLTLASDSNIQVISNDEIYYIFTEVEFNNLGIYVQTVRIFIILFAIALIINLIFSRLIDEISYSRDEKVKLIKYDATHDSLTGLPNRSYVLDIIKNKLEADEKFTLLFVDFDGFKSVNDNFGHDTGDLALIEGYRRIQSKIKETDVLARFGGDEFVVILNDDFVEEKIEIVCKSILESFEPIFSFASHEFNLGLSIGACINNEKSYSLDEIIKFADQSMYDVKNNEKNFYKIYNESVNHAKE